MKKPLALTCLLLLSPLLGAADLKLPEKVQGDPGTFIQVAATTDGKIIKWYAVDPGLNLFPVDLLRDTRTAVVTSTVPGSYRLLAYTADKDGGPSDPAVCTVVIGVPPTPPPPPPPLPTDPFAQAVAAAYARETDAARAQDVAFLAAFYKGAGKLLDLPTTRTAGGLFTELSTRIHDPDVGIPKGTLPLVSKVIGDEFNKVLGTDPTRAVDAAAARTEFAKIAAALAPLR